MVPKKLTQIQTMQLTISNKNLICIKILITITPFIFISQITDYTNIWDAFGLQIGSLFGLFLAKNITKYGTKNVCGSLVNDPIEKCFVFTMLTNTIRGWITKDEVMKIIKLSEVLTPPFAPDDKWFKEEKDEFGRKIIKNKYRILDNIYQENFNK